MTDDEITRIRSRLIKGELWSDMHDDLIAVMDEMDRLRVERDVLAEFQERRRREDRERGRGPRPILSVEQKHDRHPAFESLPSGIDIAHWFVDEMRHEGNVGGDAWWLCREPHSSARMLAFVDYDVQEFWLLDIATEDTKDLLFVTNGLDGLWCEWWQHSMSTLGGAPHWYSNGITWLASQIDVHSERVNSVTTREEG